MIDHPFRFCRGLFAALLLLAFTCAGAVPKAAEHEDAPVTFGDAAPPPKPASKAAAKPTMAPAKTARNTAHTTPQTKTRVTRTQPGRAGSQPSAAHKTPGKGKDSGRRH